MLRGERSGAKYQLAGRVRVKVVRVNLEQAKIDFTLVEAVIPAEAGIQPKRGRAPDWVPASAGTTASSAGTTASSAGTTASKKPRDIDKKMKKIEKYK
jgi:ribonuclease R